MNRDEWYELVDLGTGERIARVRSAIHARMLSSLWQLWILHGDELYV